MSMLYLSLLGVGILLTALYAAGEISRMGPSGMTLHPGILFSLYFSLVHFITPAVKHVAGIYRYQAFYSETAMGLTGAYSIVIFCIAALLFRHRASAAAPLPRSVDDDAGVDACHKVGLLLFAIGAGAAYRDLRVINETIGFLNFRTDLLASSELRGSGRMLVNLMFPGSAMFLAGALGSERVSKFRIAVLAGMIIFAANYFSAISSRNSIMIMGLLLVVVWLFYRPDQQHITGKGFRSLIIVFTGLALSLMAYQFTLSRYSLVDSYYTRLRRENVALYMLDGAFGNDEALIWMTDKAYPLAWGQTYIAGVLNLVPRQIWPEKPLGAGPMLINLVRPGAYVPGRENNNSLTTGLLTEARLNFGLLGVIPVVLLWAKLASMAFRSARYARYRPYAVLMLVVATLASTTFIYSEFLGWFGRLVMMIAPAVLATAAYRAVMNPATMNNGKPGRAR